MNKNRDYGLPGGHIEEEDKYIDNTMKRELMEECGIQADQLYRKDFFFHTNGIIVLAYIGVAVSMNIESKQSNLEGIPKWISKSEFKSIDIEPNYRKLVLDYWV